MRKPLTTALCIGLAFTGGLAAQDTDRELVQSLGEFPAVLPQVPSVGVWPPEELRRQDVYHKLRARHERAIPALVDGLGDSDVRVRRGVALYLNVAGSAWGGLAERPLPIDEALPALMQAVGDQDWRVQALAAQAIGEIGPKAAAAVPILIELLGEPDEGLRNSACIALIGIGPGAAAGLPALRVALNAPEQNVRRFAERAIGRIEGRTR